MNDRPSASPVAARVLVTRPGPAGVTLTAALASHGLEALHLPLISFQPAADPAALESAIGRSSSYDWLIFTSPRAVEAVDASAPDQSWKRVPCAAVGPATSSALEERGVRARIVSASASSSGLPAALGDVRTQRIMLPTSQLAAGDLPRELRARGAVVDVVEAYRTEEVRPSRAEIDAIGPIDLVVLGSPSAVRVYAAAVRPALVRAAGEPGLVCIGPVTAEAARECGLMADMVADQPSIESLCRAVLDAVSSRAEAGVSR